MQPYISGKTLVISGEMDIAVSSQIDDAHRRMAEIAEACGYIVTRHGRTILHVSGGDILGYVALDWFEPGRPGPTSIEVWTAKTFYLEDGRMITPGEYLSSERNDHA